MCEPVWSRLAWVTERLLQNLHGDGPWRAYTSNDTVDVRLVERVFPLIALAAALGTMAHLPKQNQPKPAEPSRGAPSAMIEWKMADQCRQMIAMHDRMAGPNTTANDLRQSAQSKISERTKENTNEMQHDGSNQRQRS